MSIEKVRAYFKTQGIEDRILEFDVSSATVELAAQAVGCEPGRIAKTRSFSVGGDPILVVTAGDTKIDMEEALFKLKAYFGIETLLLEGGSILNGAFQRAGVIDELSLVVAPTVADAEDKPLFMDARMEHYHLEDVQYRNDTLWLNYKRK